jgi:hypothetical protein
MTDEETTAVENRLTALEIDYRKLSRDQAQNTLALMKIVALLKEEAGAMQSQVAECSVVPGASNV